MLMANLTNALQSLYTKPNVSGKPPTSSNTNQPPANQASQLTEGQEVAGVVQTKVSDNVFKIQVAGQTIQLRLPTDAQIGSTIRLEVIRTQPQIAFGIITSNNPLATPEQISSTARLIANLAEQPLERPNIRAIHQPAIWQASEQEAPDSKKLASALQTSLTQSGLFYESHQAQWIRGERALNQLLTEPQNQLAQPSKAPQDLMPRELMPLVQQQLHTLETKHLIWSGQVWPEQNMRWEIQGQPEPHPRQTPSRQWQTKMELELPNLGGVCAELSLTETGLMLTLTATEHLTADKLTAALPDLKSTLSKAGIPVISTVIRNL